MRFRWRMFKYGLGRKRDGLAAWTANHLPRRIVYWTIIRAAVKDEQGHPGYVDALTMLKRFE